MTAIEVYACITCLYSSKLLDEMELSEKKTVSGLEPAAAKESNAKTIGESKTRVSAALGATTSASAIITSTGGDEADCTTRLINVKAKHLKPKYDNLIQWCNASENHAYIGRGGIMFTKQADGSKNRIPYADSFWANPFKVKGSTREKAIKDFEAYIRDKIDKDTEGVMMSELLKLKGKTLGCWCAPLGCHGDVLLKMIDEYSR